MDRDEARRVLVEYQRRLSLYAAYELHMDNDAEFYPALAVALAALDRLEALEQERRALAAAWREEKKYRRRNARGECCMFCLAVKGEAHDAACLGPLLDALTKETP